jgi:hypothetical protein
MARPGRIAACCPEAPLGVNAALPLLTRLAEVLSHSEAVRDPSDTAALHSLRIAVKRLRYTLEILSDVVPGSEGFLKTLRMLQDELGAIHDADVLIPVIEADMGDNGEAPGLRALLDRTREERLEAFRRFADAWGWEEQAGFAAQLRQAALSAGRPFAAASAATPGDAPMVSDPAVANAIALLRLVPFCPTGDGKRGRALSRAVSRLARAARTDDGRLKVKAISRANRRLARALVKASR